MNVTRHCCKNNFIYIFFGFSIFFVSSAFSQSVLPIDQVKHELSKTIDRESYLIQEIDQMVSLSHTYSKKSGVSHYYFQQQFNGLAVYQSFLDVHFNALGEMISFHHNFQSLESNIQAHPFQIEPQKAIELAIQHLKLPHPKDGIQIEKKGNQYTFTIEKIAAEDVIAIPMYYFSNDQQLFPIWNFSILTLDAKHRWNFIVHAATGEIIKCSDMVLHCTFPHHKHDKKNHSPSKIAEVSNLPFSIIQEEEVDCQYKIFPQPVENPNDGNRVMIANPADEVASPFGWHDINGVPGHDYTITRGNNIYAQTDETGFNTTGFSPDGGDELIFNFPFDSNENKEYNKAAAVTNLFYWCNYMHDLVYNHGFDEEAGNFQQNNYERGGIQGDFIIADAQDQGGRNNANFSCGPDGSRGRIQMYLWDNADAGVQFRANNTLEEYSFTAIEAQFGPALTAQIIEAPLAFASSEIPNLACEAVETDLIGKIALVDRGSCLFVNKVMNAQDAGAIACVVCNNNNNEPFAMGGENDAIQIPSVMISKADCELLKQQMTTDEITLQLSNNPNEHDIDSDFDNAVIAHEYAHGVSLRLTGGAAVVNCLTNAEQMGEGWSDFFALIATMKEEDQANMPRTIGTYILNQDLDGLGLRPTPYSTDMNINPATYSNIKNETSSHRVGYVWASMLWELAWEFIDEYGKETGKDLILDLIIEGMKFLPCHPGFVEARDAIFEADQALFDGEHTQHIWRAFAKRGLGYSANQGSPHDTGDGITAFDYPPCMFPNAYCASQVVFLGPYGGAFLSAALLNNGSTDCNGELNYTIEDESFLYLDCEDVGIKEVQLEVTNTLGVRSYCHTSVIVFDTISPIALCQNKTVNLSSPIISVEELAGYSVDNCTPKEDLSYNFDTITFTEEDLGKNQFEIIVQDASGNRDSCLAVVNIAAAISPLQKDKNIYQDGLKIKQPLVTNSLFDFQLFPNPAHDWLQLNLELPLENCKILLFNSKGEKVLESTFAKNTSHKKIDIQNLASGVYIVQLKNATSKITKKLIVH